VNYGNREDYEQLDRLGISVKGAIVIARYGQGWRGIKPKVERSMAHRCIIYSTPRTTDFSTATIIRRVGGDRAKACNAAASWTRIILEIPLTPGVGATADAKRLDIKDARPLQRFPCCDFLGRCSAFAFGFAGSGAPEEWRAVCRLPIMSVPAAKVHLKVASTGT